MKKLLEQLRSAIYGTATAIDGFGSGFGLEREDEWTYHFGDIPILDMEHKTGEVPRWLANFYHGTRPDPDEGGPWENNVIFETITGPTAIAVLDEDDHIRAIVAHVVKGTEDYYTVSEELLVSKQDERRFVAQFNRSYVNYLEATSKALENANKEEVAEYDVVFFLNEDGRVLLGEVAAIKDPANILMSIRQFFGTANLYGDSAELKVNYPDPAKPVIVTEADLFPVPVSGFGYEQ